MIRTTLDVNLLCLFNCIKHTIFSWKLVLPHLSSRLRYCTFVRHAQLNCEIDKFLLVYVWWVCKWNSYQGWIS